MEGHRGRPRVALPDLTPLPVPWATAARRVQGPAARPEPEAHRFPRPEVARRAARGRRTLHHRQRDRSAAVFDIRPLRGPLLRVKMRVELRRRDCRDQAPRNNQCRPEAAR